MRIALTSDLHLEGDRDAWQPVLTVSANVLVLAGDIIEVRKAYEHAEFYAAVSAAFEHVIVVMGNHEHWHGNIAYTEERYRKFLSQWSNIHLLEKDFTIIDGVVFAGCTLWGGMNNGNPLTFYHCDRAVNDSRRITAVTGKNYHKWHSELTYREHCKSKAWLADFLASVSMPTVVVTHHAPSEESVPTHYRTARDYHSNGAYWSDMTPLMNNHVRVWCHGHMHSPSDYMVGNTRVLNHPRGYPGWDQTKDWEPLVFIVEP